MPLPIETQIKSGTDKVSPGAFKLNRSTAGLKDGPGKFSKL
jgi:hypothetical protein